MQMFRGSQLLFSHSDFREVAVSCAALLPIIIVHLSLSSREQTSFVCFLEIACTD